MNTKGSSAVVNQVRVVIASTFTAEPLKSTLNFWFNKVNLGIDVQFAPFDQVFQELVNPSSVLSQNKTGVNIVLLRFEDWKNPEQHVLELSELVKQKVTQSGVPFIILTCPPSPKVRKEIKRAQMFESLHNKLVEEFRSHTQVHVMSGAEVLAAYPVTEIDDTDSDDYARMPYTEDFFVTLGTALARKVHSIRRAGPKVLVLDCDNTLWHGVIGEDGVDGITLDAGRIYLQEFVVRQAKAGVLITLCSKNNEADVWEVFDKRKDMVLKREHIVGHRINWEPKSNNISSLAKELNLGVDSFVFFDDSPVECEEVRQNCPGVTIVQIPARNPEQIRIELDHHWMLDERKVTETDRKRGEMYVQNAKREELRKTTGTLQDFVGSLRVEVKFVPLSEKNVSRVAQMTQRTNQFNMTTIRRTEADVWTFVRDQGGHCLLVDVSDRFGDYGIVGLVLFEVDPKCLTVDTFLLSCRALGRGVEQKILKRLGEIAQENGAPGLEIPFVVSSKNMPARQFLEGTVKQFCTETKQGESFMYRVPTKFAIESGDKAMVIQFEEEDKKATSAALPPPPVSGDEWLQIASRLNTITSIKEHVRASAKIKRETGKTLVVAPRNDLELRMVEALKDVLAVDEIGINDNYFALGCDSLKSLQFVAKLKKLGHKLTMTEVLQHTTVAALAESVAAKQKAAA